MIPVLFARSDSVYKQIPGCDVYDAERNAYNYLGSESVIAHPPCRAWGRLRHFAKPRPGEKDLARFAVSKIRTNGGVLEHPAFSSLWKDQNLPLPGCGQDALGGFTLGISQNWFGHKAKKNTWLYIVGIAPSQIPPIVLDLSYPTHTIGKHSTSNSRLPEVTKAEREHTPLDLALWLVDLVKSIPSESVGCSYTHTLPRNPGVNTHINQHGVD